MRIGGRGLGSGRCFLGNIEVLRAKTNVCAHERFLLILFLGVFYVFKLFECVVETMLTRLGILMGVAGGVAGA